MTELNATQQNLDIRNSNSISPSMRESKLPCTVGQLLAITLPIMVAGIFAAIFVPVYVKNKKENTRFYVVYANNTAVNNSVMAMMLVIMEKTKPLEMMEKMELQMRKLSLMNSKKISQMLHMPPLHQKVAMIIF